MTSAHYALVALFFYALSNIMIDRFFSHVDPLISVFVYCSIIAGMAAIGLALKYHRGASIVLPTGYLWSIIALCGVGCFFADGAFFTAYNIGGPGSLGQITTIVATMPVFAMIIKAMIDWNTPSFTQLSAGLLATAAVYMASR